jgi:hypothetical protein
LLKPEYLIFPSKSHVFKAAGLLTSAFPQQAVGPFAVVPCISEFWLQVVCMLVNEALLKC